MLYLKSTLTKTAILLIIMNLFSCISLKDVQLIQPDQNLKLDAKGKIAFDKPEYYIQKGDRILINVSSASKESMGILSDFISSGNQTFVLGENSGVLVRKDGNIELPRIGNIHVEGFTIEQVRKIIQDEFYKIYDEKGTFIDVNLAGIEYTIVGEVSQGTFRANKRDLTILEAFAKTGSNNIYADLKNVRIIRTDLDGTKQVYVDLTKESIMNSEYYWIQNNDIIVVNPRKEKVWGVGLNPLSVVTTVMGAIATILGVYLFFDKI
ncbi:polysaccharide biosynthesis/export family protein [Empedobacter falsenii]|uniref:polysaccharide biosynthesis/export family protein n=1 Tax=Empedobacter sp. UBA7494 TaxID=1946450 RepID=UPI0025BBA549|nr:polysaccharide biosynthesis/export family protein [Empedobacter sp. UBA7494]